MRKNCLECKGLAQVAAIRAWLVSLGDSGFNRLLRSKLGSEHLEIPLNNKLLQTEDLKLGDPVFRPSDLVVFPDEDEPAGSNWQAENAVCVGWKLGKQGKVQFDEPLFLGAGLIYSSGPNKGFQKVLTEAGMKEEIWKMTIFRPAYARKLIAQGYKEKEASIEAAIAGERYQIEIDDPGLKRHFEQKGLAVQQEKPKGLALGLPEIYLNSIVSRLALLGGMKDLK